MNISRRQFGIRSIGAAVAAAVGAMAGTAGAKRAGWTDYPAVDFSTLEPHAFTRAVAQRIRAQQAPTAALAAAAPPVAFRCNALARPAERFREATGRHDVHTVRVFIDGEEITSDCDAFDAWHGWARCLAPKGSGKFIHTIRNEDGTRWPVPRDGSELENKIRPIDPITGETIREFRYGTITTQPPLAELAAALGPVCWADPAPAVNDDMAALWATDPEAANCYTYQLGRRYAFQSPGGYVHQ